VQTRWTATDDSPGPPLGPVPDSPGDQFRVAPPPVTLTLDAAAALDDGGRPTDLAVPARTGVDGWSTVLERQDGASVTVGDGPLLRARFTPSLDGVDGQERVAYGVVTFTSWTPGTEPVPALAGGSLLDDTEAGTGSTLVLPVGDATVDVELTGSVRYLPGLDPASAQLVVDADRLGRRVIELGGAPPPPTDWWVGVPDGRADAYAADLTARGAGTVRTAHGTARALLEQPLRLSIGGVLWLVVAGAAAFAAVGFAVHTTVAVRLRRVEFAQLQALGATRRALDAVVVVENLLLVGLGTLAGTGLGVLLGRLVSPLVALTAEGNAPLPGVVVHLPWGQVLLLVAGIGAVLAVTLAVVLRVLRTGGPGGILRLGDER